MLAGKIRYYGTAVDSIEGLATSLHTWQDWHQ